MGWSPIKDMVSPSSEKIEFSVKKWQDLAHLQSLFLVTVCVGRLGVIFRENSFRGYLRRR